MSIDWLDRRIVGLPLLGRYYARRAASLKRSYCLALWRTGRLTPFAFVQWLATYQCNYRCPYCEASAGEVSVVELTTEEVKRLIDDLAAMRVRRLFVSGGEPLVRADVPELIVYANQRGLAVGLASNGSLVAARWELLRHGRYFLYFTSIDGVPAYNDRVRGHDGACAAALRSLELFETLKVPTRMVNTVVHPANFDQLPELFRLIKSSAANRWHLTPIESVGRAAAGGESTLNGAQLHELVRFARAHTGELTVDLAESHSYLGCLAGGPVGKPFFCGAGLTRCSIMPDGDVLGCQQVYDRRFSEGNIRERPFPEIWREGFGRFRRRTTRPGCARCEHLGACGGGCWSEHELHGGCLKGLWAGTRE